MYIVSRGTLHSNFNTHTHTPPFLQEDLVRQVKEGTLVCDDRNSVISSSPTTNQTSNTTQQDKEQKSSGQQENG